MTDPSTQYEITETHEAPRPGVQSQTLDLSKPDGLMAALLQSAPNSDPQKLDQLATIYERLQAGTARQAFARAMAEMQPKLPAINKGGDNLHLKTKYARLEDIQSAIRPLMSEHGFSARWSSQTLDGEIHVTCTVTHADGHSESDTMPLPIVKQNGTNELQQRGIAMSYGKRYTLCNVLGIQLGGEDNDGTDPLSGDTLSPDQVKTIRDLLAIVSRDEDKFLAFMQSKGVIVATALEDVPVESFNAMQATLAGLAKKAGDANGQ